MSGPSSPVADPGETQVPIYTEAGKFQGPAVIPAEYHERITLETQLKLNTEPWAIGYFIAVNSVTHNIYIIAGVVARTDITNAKGFRATEVHLLRRTSPSTTSGCTPFQVHPAQFWLEAPTQEVAHGTIHGFQWKPPDLLMLKPDDVHLLFQPYNELPKPRCWPTPGPVINLANASSESRSLARKTRASSPPSPASPATSPYIQRPRGGQRQRVSPAPTKRFKGESSQGGNLHHLQVSLPSATWSARKCVHTCLCHTSVALLASFVRACGHD
jgi:hypothetical protein